MEHQTMQRGKFIAIDGIDGSGKGSIVKRLVAYLFDRDKRAHVWLTREPYNTVHQVRIRELLATASNPRDFAEELTELFVADRREHLVDVEASLRRGSHVVSDRFKYSTLVYQSMQGVDPKRLIEMHAGMLVPDLTVLIDVPAETALERITHDPARKGKKEVFERDIATMQSLRERFLLLPSILPAERIVIVDGVGTPEEVFRRVAEVVETLFA
jgi:dTMP kinase